MLLNPRAAKHIIFSYFNRITFRSSRNSNRFDCYVYFKNPIFKKSIAENNMNPYVRKESKILKLSGKYTSKFNNNEQMQNFL